MKNFWMLFGMAIGGIATATGAAALLAFALISTSIFGGLGGWLVDHPWIFDGEVAATLAAYGLPLVPLWKVGATLGFLSSALPKLMSVKTTSTTS